MTLELELNWGLIAELRERACKRFLVLPAQSHLRQSYGFLELH